MCGVGKERKEEKPKVSEKLVLSFTTKGVVFRGEKKSETKKKKPSLLVGYLFV